MSSPYVPYGFVASGWAATVGGKRGNPDVCVASSPSVIVLGPSVGTVTPGGSRSATSVSSPTSRRWIESASISDVNTFVTEPISNSVRPSGGLPPGPVPKP